MNLIIVSRGDLMSQLWLKRLTSHTEMENNSNLKKLTPIFWLSSWGFSTDIISVF